MVLGSNGEAMSLHIVALMGGGTGTLVQRSPLGFFVAFGAGIVSFLSPCVLPLVPSYLSMMSGVSVMSGAGGADLAGEQRHRARVLWSTLLFVAGFSVVFACLEATANALSDPLHAHQLVLEDVAGALIVVMGLVVAGILRVPRLQREHRLTVRPSRLGPWAAPVMGMTFAFGWTPCITPVLAAVLGLASSGGTLARGEEMLVAYSFGPRRPVRAHGLGLGAPLRCPGFCPASFPIGQCRLGPGPGRAGCPHYNRGGRRGLLVVLQPPARRGARDAGHGMSSPSERPSLAVRFRGAVALAGLYPLLAGVDLDVAAGEILVVKGANGAGKTSLLRVMAGLLPLAAGEAAVLGLDPPPRHGTCAARWACSAIAMGSTTTSRPRRTSVSACGRRGSPRRRCPRPSTGWVSPTASGTCP